MNVGHDEEGDSGRQSSGSLDLRGLLAAAISSTIDEGTEGWHEGFMDAVPARGKQVQETFPTLTPQP